MGEVRSLPLYIVRGLPPWTNRHLILCVGSRSRNDLHSHFSCMVYGASWVAPTWPSRHVILCGGRPSHSDLQAHFIFMAYEGIWVSPLIYSERSLPLGPMYMSSCERVGCHTGTYRPNSHALYLRGKTPLPPKVMHEKRACRSLCEGLSMQRMMCLLGQGGATSQRKLHTRGRPTSARGGRSPLVQQTHHPLCGQALAQRPTGPNFMHGLWGKRVLSTYM